jgi:hypothetical protein
MRAAFLLKVALAMLMLVTAFPAAAAEQPHMKAALELLQSAKKSDNPKPMLLAAQRHKKNAKRNKGGALGQAAESLREAIALAELGGDKKKLEQKINATIANLQNGMGNAK